MAKVILADFIKELHGSVDKSSPYYYRTDKNGNVFLCRKPERRTV